MARRRRTERIVVIPDCEDRERRARLEADDIAWLMFYFGEGCELSDPFWYEFTPQQVTMIEAIRHAIRYGGDQAIAASRGEGKTTIAERLLLKCTLTGEVNYSVLFASTGQMADNSLDSIKTAVADNPLLAADYPEICWPVISLEGVPQRASGQLVSGNRFDNGEPFEAAASKFSWCGQEVIFPNVPGAPAARAIMATRGLDAAVRGLKKRGKRPQVAVIDDPDTEDTARSEEQADKLETRIDAAIGGLGGQQRPIGRVMLTTLQSRVAVSYRYTDPAQKPTFKGKRFRFMIQPPERDDLWDEYVQLRKHDLQRVDESGVNLDPFARNAHQFYLNRRESMDAGAIVANPNRFNGQELPDGTTEEVSAIQHYYNVVAKIGLDKTATEYDNDPPELSESLDSGLSANRIQRQVSGYPMRVVPPGCVKLTQGIDVRKTLLHCVVRAWRADGTGYTIDHHSETVYGVKYRSDVGVDEAIRNAIRTRMTSIRDDPYTDLDGNAIPIDLTLIDAGWRTDVIYAACREIGFMTIKPAMGIGKSAGCVQTSFRMPKAGSKTTKTIVGDGWFQSAPRRMPLVSMDADRWKSYEHDRWLTPTDQPGTMFIWGEGGDERRLSEDERAHHNYAHHIIAEREVEEEVRGVLVRRWKPRSSNNHFLDASYMSCVAANMVGIRIQTQAEMAAAARGRKPRRSLAEAAAEARARG